MRLHKFCVIILCNFIVACAKPTYDTVQATAAIKQLPSLWQSQGNPTWTIDFTQANLAVDKPFAINAQLGVGDTTTCQGTSVITQMFDNMAHDTASGAITISVSTTGLCSQLNGQWDYYLLVDGLLLCPTGAYNCIEFH